MAAAQTFKYVLGLAGQGNGSGPVAQLPSDFGKPQVSPAALGLKAVVVRFLPGQLLVEVTGLP
jgi:hypothetical protein